VISCPGFIPFPCQYLISNFSRFLTFVKAGKQTMEGDSIWGSKDFQVPEYINFADVIDEWSQKEKVRWRDIAVEKRILISVSAQKTMSIFNVL